MQIVGLEDEYWLNRLQKSEDKPHALPLRI